jgi:hypothetical protein
MNKVISKLVQSRKFWLFVTYSAAITFMAYQLHGSYAEWGGYFIGGFTLIGIGMQHDKVYKLDGGNNA